MAIDLNHLTRTKPVRGVQKTTIIPCLSLILYSELTLRELGPALGEAMKKYLNFIPPATLRSCWVSDTTRELTDRKINKDLKTLENVPKHKEEFYLEYSQGKEGSPGTHGILIFADEFYKNDENSTNLLRLDLPWDSSEGANVNSIFDFFVEIADEFPFSTGNAGFAFSFNIFDRVARGQKDAMLPRYLGFDASEEVCRNLMRGRTPPAHWINFLSNDMLTKVGGIDALKAAVPKAVIREINGGIMIRCAEYPPVADINTGAPDIGVMPDLARFLKDIRLRMYCLRWTEKEKVDGWLDRFDELESKEWRNR